MKVTKHRCEFSAYGSQCRNPGAISASVTGGGPWLCREHWRLRDDPTIGQELVYRQTREPVPAPEDDWRTDLVEQRRLELGLVRRHDEPREVFIARCKAAIAKLGPVFKTPRKEPDHA